MAYPYCAMGNAIPCSNASCVSFPCLGLILRLHGESWHAHLLHDVSANLLLVRVPRDWHRTGSYASTRSILEWCIEGSSVLAATALATTSANYHVWVCCIRVWISINAYNERSLGSYIWTVPVVPKSRRSAVHDLQSAAYGMLLLRYLDHARESVLRHAWLLRCCRWCRSRSAHSMATDLLR